VTPADGRANKNERDYFNARTAWIHANNLAIASYQEAHAPGQPPEAGEAWWIRYNMPRDPQRLFTLVGPQPWQEATLLWQQHQRPAACSPGHNPMAPSRLASLPPPSYRPPDTFAHHNRNLPPPLTYVPTPASQGHVDSIYVQSQEHRQPPHMPVHAQHGSGSLIPHCNSWPSAAPSFAGHSLAASAMPPAPSWPPLGGIPSDTGHPVRPWLPFGGLLAPLPAGRGHPLPLEPHRAPAGQDQRGLLTLEPQQAPYLALANMPVMALIQDTQGVGRWTSCHFYYPTTTPNTQGVFEDTVMNANSRMVTVDRSKIAPGQSGRLGTEWRPGDWGSPYLSPVPSLAATVHPHPEFPGVLSFRAINYIREFAETKPTAHALIIIYAMLKAGCEPLRRLVEMRFRLTINTQDPSASVFPSLSDLHGHHVTTLTCPALLSMLEAEMPHGSFHWTPKKARTAPDCQFDQLQPHAQFGTPPKFDLEQFGDNLAKGLLHGMAKLQAAATESVLQTTHNGRSADVNDADSDEKMLQRRIALVRKEPFHQLKLNNDDDIQSWLGACYLL